MAATVDTSPINDTSKSPLSDLSEPANDDVSSDTKCANGAGTPSISSPDKETKPDGSCSNDQITKECEPGSDQANHSSEDHQECSDSGGKGKSGSSEDLPKIGDLKLEEKPSDPASAEVMDGPVCNGQPGAEDGMEPETNSAKEEDTDQPALEEIAVPVVVEKAETIPKDQGEDDAGSIPTVAGDVPLPAADAPAATGADGVEAMDQTGAATEGLVVPDTTGIDADAKAVDGAGLDTTSPATAESAPELPPAVLPVDETIEGTTESGSVEKATESEATTTVSDSSSVIPAPTSLTPESQYQIKWVDITKVPKAIVMQNENGPCPLLSIVNLLLLRGNIQLPVGQTTISSLDLVSTVASYLVGYAEKKKIPDDLRADHEQNLTDAIHNMNKLLTGLDVNVKFNNIRDFEFTSECLIFDLLDIPLYHGWLADPQNEASMRVVGPRSYNQLTELILSGKETEDVKAIEDALIAEQFLEHTASQLTYHGIAELISHLRDGELAVFFRNNHFSVIHRHRDELFLLVTDQGYLNEINVIWETLNNVEGDSHLVDMEYHTVTPGQVPTAAATLTTIDPTSPDQVDHDYAVALSLEEQEITKPTGTPETSGDYDLAKRLQAEEETSAAASPAGGEPGSVGPSTPSAQVASPSGQSTGSTSSQDKKDKKSCIIS